MNLSRYQGVRVCQSSLGRGNHVVFDNMDDVIQIGQTSSASCNSYDFNPTEFQLCKHMSPHETTGTGDGYTRKFMVVPLSVNH